MSKSLGTKEAVSIINRIMNLQPGAAPLWGNLSVTGMLFHCTKVANEILAAPHSADTPTFKEKMIKTIGLYVMKKFPKGVKSSDRYVSKDESSIDFITERNELISIINKACNYKEPIYGRHPFFGPMHTKEWKQFLYKHLDHHLRQFQV